jgi:hypothetical protein
MTMYRFFVELAGDNVFEKHILHALCSRLTNEVPDVRAADDGREGVEGL